MSYKNIIAEVFKPGDTVKMQFRSVDSERRSGKNDQFAVVTLAGDRKIRTFSYGAILEQLLKVRPADWNLRDMENDCEVLVTFFTDGTCGGALTDGNLVYDVTVNLENCVVFSMNEADGFLHVHEVVCDTNHIIESLDLTGMGSKVWREIRRFTRQLIGELNARQKQARG